MTEMPYWAKELLADLDGLAETLTEYRVKHADDVVKPVPEYCAGLEIAAELLREKITQARKLAADA